MKTYRLVKIDPPTGSRQVLTVYTDGIEAQSEADALNAACRDRNSCERPLFKVVEFEKPTMNRADYPELESYYSATADRYDLDQYALDVHLDTAGMWTPAYETMVTDALCFMDGYNATRHHGTGETLARWLQVFARPTFWIVFCAAQMLVALLAR